MLHALQVLIENSIGKAKQILKANEKSVPVSGYDAFKALARIKKMSENDLPEWNAVIGLRNRIVHEYMNVDITLVLNLVRENRIAFVVAFLLAPIDV